MANYTYCRFGLLLALHVFCADYHSGKWSRLYRLGRLTGSRLRSLGVNSRELDAKLYSVVRRGPSYRRLVRRLLSGKFHSAR